MKHALIALALSAVLAAPAFAAPRPTVTTSVQAGDVISNTASLTAFSTKLVFDPTGTSPALTTGTDTRYGMAWKVDLWGVYSTLATPGTFTFDLRAFNGATTYTLGTTGAVTPPASQTNAEWEFHGVCVYNTTGSSGIATCQGSLDFTAAGVVTREPMVLTGTGTTNWTTAVVTNAAALTGIEPMLTMQTASSSNAMTLGLALYTPVN